MQMLASASVAGDTFTAIVIGGMILVALALGLMSAGAFDHYDGEEHDEETEDAEKG